MSADPLAAWQETLGRLHAWTPNEDGGSLLAELAGLPAIKAALPPELESLRALRKRFVGAGDATLVDPAAEHARHPLFRRLPDLSRGALIQRCALPFFVLFAVNYLANEFVYEVAGRHEEVAAACPGESPEPAQPRLWTVLLWGSLSMYMGVFLGLIAQGDRLNDQE